MGLKLAMVALVSCIASPALAEQAPLQSGRWSAGVLRSAWSLADWTDQCGPSPVGGSEAGGIVTLTRTGAEFTISGLGRTFSSSSCWDQQPGLSAVAHTAGARQWTTTCRSAPGDPRRVTVTTVLVLNGSTLDLDETGKYEVAIAGRQCVASVRRTRRFALVQQEEESPPIVSSAPEKTVTPCSQPGPVVRIEAAPTYKLLRRGEQFSFRARLFDEKGCTVANRVNWKLAKPYPGVKLDSTGILAVASNAPEGEVQVQAQYADHLVQVAVYVVSAQRYAELLSSPSFNTAGESEARAEKTIVPNVLGGRVTEIASAARRRRTAFVWAGTAMAVLLGAAALALWRRRRRWAPTATSDPPARVSGPPEAYSHTEPVREPVRRICPVCGTQYEGENQFCGKDGAVLVPLN